jgi:predicted phage terminase large subunit-like protein
MIFMPPRHGKTELTTKRMSAFIFGKNPDAHIIGISYGADLAWDNSRGIQQIIRTPEYAELFPNTRIGGKHGKESVEMFTIDGRNGYYVAAGIRGPIGGKGASFGLIDDPVKNAEEAESDVYRDGNWAWYQSTFYPRLESPGAILLTTTRWHDDDLAGRLLKHATQEGGDQWEVLNLPAIAEAIRHPKDPREKGEALWPGRYPLTRPDGEVGPTLTAIRNTIGPSWFQALYQGDPVPPGGDLFKREWFQIVQPSAVPTSNMQWCRFWDAAGSQDAGDYTAGVKMGWHFPTKTSYFVHVVRGQWSTGTVDEIIHSTAISDGYACRVREEREPGSSGLAVINARRKTLVGFDYRGMPATGEKTLRWKPMAAQAEGNNVKLVAGPWNAAFLDELVLAPKGKHDDQIDAAAGAFNELVLGPGQIQVVKLSGF